VLAAKGPDRLYDKARFGPTFMANVVVATCADAIPLNRQAKAYERAGVPMSRQTLTDVFHRVADITAPLSRRPLEIIARSPVVLADETTIRLQEKEKTRTAWLWDFITRTENDDKELIAYVFSRSRSGETPLRVLANTTGKLLTDPYGGYDNVTASGAVR
jgi:transposase